MIERRYYKEVALSPEDWINQNLEYIVRIMETKRHMLLKRHKIPPSSLSLNERWLSEMPLCEAWGKIRQNIGLPTGFKVGMTEVFVSSGEFSKQQRLHFCAFGRGEEILCITPGQFVKVSSQAMGPGKRIGVILEKAPELIKTYPGGIAVLHGRGNVIGAKLGIWY